MKRVTMISVLLFIIMVIAEKGSAVPVNKMSKELPELKVDYHKNRVLHILAYVREYSNMTTYGDSVFLFREKWVDYMVPNKGVKRYNGWVIPRVISNKSYYRFSNGRGLDSVSDRYHQLFSWADWIGITNGIPLPSRLTHHSNSTDTLRGKYSAAEIWQRNGDEVTVNVNVLADSVANRWVPDLTLFFQNIVEFEEINLQYVFTDVISDNLYAYDLDRMKFQINSLGRGRNMFRFNRRDELFFVSTTTEIYIADKEYITVKAAKKWEKELGNEIDIADLDYPEGVPSLATDISELVARVDNLDYTGIRLNTEIDQRLVGRDLSPLKPKQRQLKQLKSLFTHKKKDPFSIW